MFAPTAYSAIESGPGHLLVSTPGSSLFGIWWLIGIPVFVLFVGHLVSNSLRNTYKKNVAQYPQLTIKPVDAEVRSNNRSLF